LIVTDDAGATASTVSNVVVSADTDPVLWAVDGFGRDVADGFGSADLGGLWNVSGSASRYSVSGGQAHHLLDVAGRSTESLLTDVAAGDVTAGVDLSFDKAPTGGGIYSYLTVRDNGTSEYRARLRVKPTGTALTLYSVADGSWTSLGAVNLPMVYAPGDVWRVSLEAVGSSPTTVSAKVWNTAEAEPVGWQVTATDSAAELQGTGGIGVANYQSGSSTNAPNTVHYDNLYAVTP